MVKERELKKGNYCRFYISKISNFLQVKDRKIWKSDPKGFSILETILSPDIDKPF
jgi:hypothetical protein